LGRDLRDRPGAEHVIDTTPVHSADLRVDIWFADHRTAWWNDATAVGTGMALTVTVVAVTAAAAHALRWRISAGTSRSSRL
jgi:hypothetical protein